MASTDELEARISAHPLLALGYGVGAPSAEALYQEAMTQVAAAQDELLSPDDPELLTGFVEESTLGQPVEFQPKAVEQLMAYAQHVPFAVVVATHSALNLVDESTQTSVPLGAATRLIAPGLNLIDLIRQGTARCDQSLYQLHLQLQGLVDETRAYVLTQAQAILHGLKTALGQYDSASGSMSLPPIVVTPTVAPLPQSYALAQAPARILSPLMQAVVDSPQTGALPYYAQGTYAFALAPDDVPDAYSLEDIVISPEEFRLELRARTELDLVTTHQCELILGGAALHFISTQSLDELLVGAEISALLAQLNLRQAAASAMALTDTYMEFNALCANLRPVAASELSAILTAPPPPPKPEPKNNGADLAALELAISLAKAKAAHGKMPSQAELDQVLASLRRH